MLESYSNPRKTPEVLQFGLKKKLLRLGFGFLVDVARVGICFAFFWFFFYDIITRTMSKNCG